MFAIFCQKIKDKRKSLKLTQTDMALKLNVTQSAYSQYENGKIEPDLITLVKIADILDTTTDDLLGRIHKMTDNGENENERGTEKLQKADEGN